MVHSRSSCGGLRLPHIGCSCKVWGPGAAREAHNGLYICVLAMKVSVSVYGDCSGSRTKPQLGVWRGERERERERERQRALREEDTVEFS